MTYDTNAKSIEVRGLAPRDSRRNYVPAILGALPSGRVRWLAPAAIMVGAGLALNWSWLVAIGVAPVLITALPCVAMCALGLCMNRGGNRESDSLPASDASIAPTCSGQAEGAKRRSGRHDEISS